MALRTAHNTGTATTSLAVPLPAAVPTAAVAPASTISQSVQSIPISTAIAAITTISALTSTLAKAIEPRERILCIRVPHHLSPCRHGELL